MLLHSPVGSESASRVPSQLVSSVTRKKQEIEELLPSLPEHLRLIRTFFTQYLVRVESLIHECGENHQEWLSNHLISINSFRQKIEGIIARFSEPRNVPYKGAKTHSIRSSISRSSNVSKTLVKLADERATLTAQKEALGGKLEILEAEARLKARYEEQMIQIEGARGIICHL